MRVIGLALIVALLALFVPRSALAQDRQPASVTSVVDGDTIKVRLDGGQVITVA